MTVRRYMKRGDLLLPEHLSDPENVIQFPTLTAKMGGFFRVRLRRKSGSIKYDTGWFNNLITDLGMDLYGQNLGYGSGGGVAVPAYCCVGTGTSAPAFSDQVLVAPLAVDGPNSPTGPAYIAGPPAYSFQTISWAWPLGGVVGNISEIAAGPLSTVAGTTLSKFRCFSRQLILDSLGNPNTISVTASDQLNTSYQLRLYFDLSDSTTSVNISGVPYGGTIRRARTSSFGVSGIMNPTTASPWWGSTAANIYTGALGSTSSSPGGGTLGYNTTAIVGTYTPGSFIKTQTAHWNTGNLGTVKAILLGNSCLGYWQAELLPGFPKTISNTLDFTWTISWSRF